MNDYTLHYSVFAFTLLADHLCCSCATPSGFLENDGYVRFAMQIALLAPRYKFWIWVQAVRSVSPAERDMVR